MQPFSDLAHVTFDVRTMLGFRPFGVFIKTSSKLTSFTRKIMASTGRKKIVFLRDSSFYWQTAQNKADIISWKWAIFASQRPCYPALKRGWSYLSQRIYLHSPEVQVPHRTAVAPVYHSVGSLLHIPQACSGVSWAGHDEEGVWGKAGFIDGPIVRPKGDRFLRFCVSAIIITDNFIYIYIYSAILWCTQTHYALHFQSEKKIQS